LPKKNRTAAPPAPTFRSIDVRPLVEALERRALMAQSAAAVAPWLAPRDPASYTYISAAEQRVSPEPAVVAAGGNLYFTAADTEHGIELWRTDGTDAGTDLVRDINPGRRGSNPEYLTAVGDTLYFSASTAADTEPLAGISGPGFELWKTDGTEAGTVKVKAWAADPATKLFNRPEHFIVVGNTLYFTMRFGSHSPSQSAGLWRTDGTDAGTVRVADMAVGETIAAGDAIYFTNQARSQLWRLAPDDTGAVLVHDFTDVHAAVVLIAGDARGVFVGANGLWHSDGTEVGTVRLSDLSNAFVSSNAAQPRGVLLDGVLLFRNGTQLDTDTVPGGHAEDLWRSDGTPAGTFRVFDFDVSNGTPLSFTVRNGAAYFTGASSVWRTDGTTAGTVQVATGRGGSEHIAVLSDGRIYGLGTDLWTADGDGAAARNVTSFSTFSNPAQPSRLTQVGDRVFFDWRTLYEVAPSNNRGPVVLPPTDTPPGRDVLRASDPDGDTLHYYWDLNGDDLFSDATGINPTVTPAQLQFLKIGITAFDPQRVRVSDCRGAFLDLADHSFSLDRASLSPFGASVVTRPGQTAVVVADATKTSFTARVRFDRLVDPASLGPRDVLATGPAGLFTWAAPEDVETETIATADGPRQVTAVTYRFAAPGGTADAPDFAADSAYQLRVLAGSVLSPDGNTQEEILLGPLRAVPEANPPTATFILPGPADASDFYAFAVTYSDESGIDPDTIDNQTVLVQRVMPAGDGSTALQDTQLRVIPISKTPAADGAWTVWYRVAVAPGAGPVLAPGTYVVSIVAGGFRVRDTYATPIDAVDSPPFEAVVPTAGPDVALENMTLRVPDPARPGAKGRASVMLRDVTAPGSPPPGPVDVTFYLSTDVYPTPDDIPLVTTHGLRPGRNGRRVSASFSIPAGLAAREYDIVVLADSAHTLAEPNEANNTGRVNFGFAVPDSRPTLEVHLVPPAAPARRRRPLSVVVELVNLGSGTARGAATLHVTLTSQTGGAGPVAIARTVRLNVRGSDDGRSKARVKVKLPVPEDWPVGPSLLDVTLEPDGALLARLRASHLDDQADVQVE